MEFFERQPLDQTRSYQEGLKPNAFESNWNRKMQCLERNECGLKVCKSPCSQ